MIRRLAVAASLVACLGLTARVDAKTKATQSEANDVKIKFDQLSDAVKKTFEKEAPGVTISEVDQETTKAGASFYEADVMIDGKNWEVRVTPEGKLISKKLDNEKKLAMKNHHFTTEVVSTDVDKKEITIKSDKGENHTAPVEGKAAASLKSLKAGEKIAITYRDDEKGDIQAVTAIRLIKATGKKAASTKSTDTETK